MTQEEIKTQLSTIFYPNLSKDIVSLGGVEDISIDNNRLKITLNFTNETIFLTLEQNIKDIFKEQFESVEVVYIAKKTKSITYGTTQKPNNRASYAKKIIAVTSGKGGVGKSTVSVNIAIALAQMGFKVGLLDADVYGPSIPRMLGVEDEKMQWNENNKIIPSCNAGIKIMSVGLTTPSKDTPLVWRSSVAVSALIQFLEDVEWGELDFMVIDMPPGTGDIQLTMSQELPIWAGVLVTTPQTISLDDVSRAIMMFKDIKIPMAGVVENMSYFIAPDTLKVYDIFGSGGGEKVAKKYNIPLLGKVPLTMSIRESSDDGRPAIIFGSDAEKESFRSITQNILKNMSYL
ncbi:MAG: ATP-binding protein [Sulfurovum sp. AS07-7]|nr:MAG: ATP-binding protein [Sulfurovum sp. AS07-7]